MKTTEAVNALSALAQETRLNVFRLLGYLTDNCCAGDGMACPPGESCAPSSSLRKTRRKVKA